MGNAPAKSQQPSRPALRVAQWICACVIPVAIVLFLRLDIAQAIDFGVILFGICCLVFNLLPDYVIGLGIVFVPTLLGVVPAAVSLAPLGTWTWWAIVFGFIMGAALTKSGLGARISTAIAARFVRGWVSLIAVIFVVELILVVIAPFANVATIVIGLSVFMPMADSLGYKPQSRPYTGCALAVALSNTVCGAIVLTGHVMNALAVNLFAPYMVITFNSWLVYITPFAVLASVLAFLIVVVACRPEHSREKQSADAMAARHKEALASLGRWNANETRVLVLTILIIVGFLIQPVFALPFDSGWLAMTLSILLFVPKIGMLDANDLKAINWPFVLFMIGIFSIGGQLSALQVNTVIAAWAMPESIGTWPTIASDMYVSAIVIALHFLCGTIAPLLSTLIPALSAFAFEHSMLLLPLFCTVLFCRVRYVFPYQDAMILLSRGMTGNTMRPKYIIYVGIALTLAVLLIVTPLGSLYWSAMAL